MKRAITVGISEFTSLVQTKFFIIGILMMPVLVGASIGFQVLAATRIDREVRTVAVIDRSGALSAGLQKEADDRNARMGTGAAQKGPHFNVRIVDPAGKSADDLRLDLSSQVKRKDLFAFVEIPENVFDPEAKDTISYYTETPSYDSLPDWLETTLGKQVSERRYREAGVDAVAVARLGKVKDVSKLGLVERGANGAAMQAKRVDPIVTFALPFGLMYLLGSLLFLVPQRGLALADLRRKTLGALAVVGVLGLQLFGRHERDDLIALDDIALLDAQLGDPPGDLRAHHHVVGRDDASQHEGRGRLRVEVVRDAAGNGQKRQDCKPDGPHVQTTV